MSKSSSSRILIKECFRCYHMLWINECYHMPFAGNWGATYAALHTVTVTFRPQQ